jgi:glycosyltransferase involved in cell wall biosynthesis
MDQNKLTASITVLMPVYNAGRYLKAAIESMLAQTHPHFVFLIINDGSTDNSKEIILSYTDPRIQYIENDKNIGLVSTLNLGLKLTETIFLARMDADDIAFPNRLEVQLNFMESNPDIGVCAGFYEVFGHENYCVQLPRKNEDIKAALLFTNVICHPLVFLRTEILKANNIEFGVPFEYEDNFKHTILELEDYALWQKLRSVTKFENIDQVLLRYRIEGQNLTSKKKELILERKKKFYSRLLNELEILPSMNNLLMHISLKNVHYCKSAEDISLFKSYLNEIIQNNRRLMVYDAKALERIVNEKWEQLFYHIVEMDIKHVIAYWKNSPSILKKQINYLIKFKVRKMLPKKKLQQTMYK